MCLYAKSLRNVKDEKTTRLSASGYFRFDARRTYRGCKKWCSDPSDHVKTDDWSKGLNEFKAAKKGVVVACAAGHDADTGVLKEITEIVLQLDTADSSSIKAFFKWVSASVSVGSQKVDAGKKEVIGLDDLPPPPPEVNVVL